MRKMGPKGARKGQGRPAWGPLSRPAQPILGPIGLNFLQREVCVNPNLCFTKTTDQNRLYIPRSRRQREGGQRIERSQRDQRGSIQILVLEIHSS